MYKLIMAHHSLKKGEALESKEPNAAKKEGWHFILQDYSNKSGRIRL